MKRRLGALVVGLTLLATFSASADQLFIRNRPFKGQVSRVSKNLGAIQIELAGLCTAADFKLSEVSGNWVVHKEGQTAALPEGMENATGKLFANGKEVAFTEENGVKLVNLQELSNALGGRLAHNPDMQAVDLNFPAGGVASASDAPKGTAQAASPAGQYILLNFGAPW